jgi:hypothetical protein
MLYKKRETAISIRHLNSDRLARELVALATEITMAKAIRISKKMLPLWQKTRPQTWELSSIWTIMHACGKQNHFAAVCRSTGNPRNTRDVRAVKHEDIPVDSSDSEESIFTIKDVSSVRSQGKQLYANMKFQDIETEFRKDLTLERHVTSWATTTCHK